MVGLGIIGLGAIGERLLPIFKDYEGMDIISVYDINVDKTSEICGKFDVKAAETVDEMLEHEAVDVVYLAVPPKFHKDLAIRIMDAGKHILCEKPLAGTIEEAKEMMDFAKDKSLVTGMNFPLYHGPGYEKLRELLDQKVIGDIRRIELLGIFPDWPRKWQVNPWIDTKDQGGFVREVFTHFIQLVQDYFGLIELVDTSVAYPEDVAGSEVDVYARGHIDGLPMVFSGMTGIGHKEDLKLMIYGTEGSLEFLNWRELFLIDRNQRVQLELESYNATYHLIDALRKSIEGVAVSLVDFEAGYHAVRVVETLLGEK